MWMAKMLIKDMSIIKSFLVSAGTDSFENRSCIEQIVYGFTIVHLPVLFYIESESKRRKGKTLFASCLYNDLIEIILELIKDALFGSCVSTEIVTFLKFFQHFSFIFCQLLGNIDTDVHDQIANFMSIPLNWRQSFVTQTQCLTRLSSRFYFYLHLRTVNGWNLCSTTKSSCRKVKQ